MTIVHVWNIGLLNIFFNSTSWKTQTIIYQHKFDSSKKVEFQMLDIGFSGYEKRTVEVNYFTPWFYTTKEVNYNYNSDWSKIDIEINELNIIF